MTTTVEFHQMASIANTATEDKSKGKPRNTKSQTNDRPPQITIEGADESTLSWPTANPIIFKIDNIGHVILVGIRYFEDNVNITDCLKLNAIQRQQTSISRTNPCTRDSTVCHSNR
eukprot:106373_1